MYQFLDKLLITIDRSELHFHSMRPKAVLRHAVLQKTFTVTKGGFALFARDTCSLES